VDFLEFIQDGINDALVEIFAAQEGVAIRCQHLIPFSGRASCGQA
jgi:hypothetical protein